jgi:hypothetical protein
LGSDNHFYTPACFNSRTMMDSIDADGELTKTQAPTSWYFTNFHTVDCWIIGLPKSDKYLKYEQLKRATNQIRNCGKIMTYTALIMIFCGFILLMIVE